MLVALIDRNANTVYVIDAQQTLDAAVCDKHLIVSCGLMRIFTDFCTGEYKGFERPKKYDGKVDVVSEKARFDWHLTREDSIDLYSQVVYCKHFKRNIRVVMLHARNKGKEGHALLFSTDEALDFVKIFHYYKARLQIEFCFVTPNTIQSSWIPACCKEAIQMQANTSLTALKLLKLEDRRQKQATQETVISIASWKRKNSINTCCYAFSAS